MFCINDKNYLLNKYPLLNEIHEILKSSPNYYVSNIEESYSNYYEDYVLVHIKYKPETFVFNMKKQDIKINIKNIKKIDIIIFYLYIKLYIYKSYDLYNLVCYQSQLINLFEIYINNFENNIFIKYFNYLTDLVKIEYRFSIKEIFSIYLIERILIKNNFNNITKDLINHLYYNNYLSYNLNLKKINYGMYNYIHTTGYDLFLSHLQHYAYKDRYDYDLEILNINNIILKDKNTQFKEKIIFKIDDVNDHYRPSTNIEDPHIRLDDIFYRTYLKKNCIIPLVSNITRLNINFIELYKELKDENIIYNFFNLNENYYKSCECLDELVKFNSKKDFLSIVSRLALIK
jgi:hypothetical protein